MEKLTIQDASRKLNISQRDVREYIRSGDLKAERDPDSEHGRWLVLMPPEGEWQDKFKAYLDELDARSEEHTTWKAPVSRTWNLTISAVSARRTSGHPPAIQLISVVWSASCGLLNAGYRCSKMK